MGFHENRFVGLDQTFSKHLKCNICSNILDNAISCLATRYCVESFCKKCVQNKRSCPKCKKPFALKRSRDLRDEDNLVVVGKHLFKTNPMANNMVSNFKIKCNFDFNGCKEVIPLSLLQTHLEVCQFKICNTCEMPLAFGQDHNCVQLLINDRNQWKEKFKEFNVKTLGQKDRQLSELTAKNLILGKELINCKQSYENCRTASITKISAQKAAIVANQETITNLKDNHSKLEQQLTELTAKNLKLDKELIESKLKYENYRTRPISETSAQKAVIIANQETITNLRDNHSKLVQQLTELTQKNLNLEKELNECQKKYQDTKQILVKNVVKKVQEGVSKNHCFPVDYIHFGLFHDTCSWQIKFCSTLLLENSPSKSDTISIEYKSIKKFMYYLNSVNSLIILKPKVFSTSNPSESVLNSKEWFDVESDDTTKTYIIIKMGQKSVEMSLRLTQLFSIKKDVNLEYEAIDSLKAEQLVERAQKKCHIPNCEHVLTTIFTSVSLQQKMEPNADPPLSSNSEDTKASEKRLSEELNAKDNDSASPITLPQKDEYIIYISDDSN